MDKTNNYQYQFFVLINDNDIYKNNTKISLQALKKYYNISVNETMNFSNDYTNIRNWINYILTDIYNNKSKYQNSIIFFVHQDVFFPENFLLRFSVLFRLVDKQKSAVIGFAGIDQYKTPHMLMKDSDKFCFTKDIAPIKVESVDEFCFCLPADLLIKHKIFLSKISSWHAYSAEFSIIFKKIGYYTYFLPIYIEHNSNRKNNKGLFKTHKNLYSLYEIYIPTLVGDIMYFNLIESLKRTILEFYYNTIRFNKKLLFISEVKYFFFEKLRIRKNLNIFFNRIIKGKRFAIIFINKNKPQIPSFSFNISQNQNIFYHVDKLDSGFITSLINSKYNILVIGVSNPLENFIYINRYNLNILFI